MQSQPFCIHTNGSGRFRRLVSRGIRSRPSYVSACTMVAVAVAVLAAISVAALTAIAVALLAAVAVADMVDVAATSAALKATEVSSWFEFLVVSSRLTGEPPKDGPVPPEPGPSECSSPPTGRHELLANALRAYCPPGVGSNCADCWCKSYRSCSRRSLLESTADRLEHPVVSCSSVSRHRLGRSVCLLDRVQGFSSYSVQQLGRSVAVWPSDRTESFVSDSVQQLDRSIGVRCLKTRSHPQTPPPDGSTLSCSRSSCCSASVCSRS